VDLTFDLKIDLRLDIALESRPADHRESHRLSGRRSSSARADRLAHHWPDVLIWHRLLAFARGVNIRVKKPRERDSLRKKLMTSGLGTVGQRSHPLK
jgi:hypothetical protein